jgi:hypothetical protein
VEAIGDRMKLARLTRRATLPTPIDDDEALIYAARV